MTMKEWARILSYLRNVGSRFLLVGGVSFSVDTCLYFSGLHIGLNTALSKAISFASGMVVAFVLNKRYTFQTREGQYGKASFVTIYGASLLINISVNSLLLRELNGALLPSEWTAFLVATLISVAINFFGLKYVVFRK